MYFTPLSTSRPLNWLARASSLYSFLFNFCLNKSDAFSFFPRPHTKMFPSWAVLLSHGIHMAVLQALQRITPVQPPQPSVPSLLVLQHWYTHLPFLLCHVLLPSGWACSDVESCCPASLTSLQTLHTLPVIWCVKIHLRAGSQAVLEMIQLSGMGRWLLSKFYYHHHYYYSGLWHVLNFQTGVKAKVFEQHFLKFKSLKSFPVWLQKAGVDLKLIRQIA